MYKKLIIQNLLCVGFFLFIPTSSLFAKTALRIQHATILTNGSYNSIPYTWGTFSFSLVNNSHQKKAVKIIIKSQDNMTVVFEYNMTLAASSVIRHDSQITVSRGEKYDVILKEKRGKKYKEVPGGTFTANVIIEYTSRMFSRKHIQITSINDNSNISNISLRKLPGIYQAKNIYNSYLTTDALPRHWSSFDSSALLIFLEPNYENMDDLQFEAIKQYVGNGGNILFASPQGILSTYKTPLKDLLPVKPLKIRTVESLPFYKKWINKKIPKNTNGIQFLDSLPVGEGLTTLKWNQYPVLRWKKYGLGSVMTLSHLPGTKTMRDSAAFIPLWNHILSNVKKNKGLSSTQNLQNHELLDLMTGNAIPESRYIFQLLSIFFISIFVILMAGHFSKYYAASWAIAAITACFFTAFIFQKAYHNSGNKTKFLGSMISYETFLENHKNTAEKLISIRPIDDSVLQFSYNSLNTRIRELPPAPTFFRNNSNITQQKSATLFNIINISQEADIIAIENMKVSGLSTRSFVIEKNNLPAAKEAYSPLLKHSKNGPTLHLETIPKKWGKSQIAFLVCPSDVIPISIKDNQIINLATIKKSDIVLGKAMETVRTLLKQKQLLTPFLCFVTTTKNIKQKDFGEQFTVNGYTLSTCQVKQEFSNEAYLTPQLLTLDFTRSSRTLQKNGKWFQETLPNSIMNYQFISVLPPGLKNMDIESLNIHLKIENTGANISSNVYLLHKEQKIFGKSNGKGSFFFKGINVKQITNSLTGRFQFGIELKPIKDVVDPVARLRLNKWKIKTLNISVHGKTTDIDKERL